MSLADGMAWEVEFGPRKGEAKKYTHLVERIGPSVGCFTKGVVYLAKSLGVCDKFLIVTDQGKAARITLSDRWKEVTAESLIKAAHEEHLAKKGNTYVVGQTAADLHLVDKSTKPTKSDGGSSAYYELNLLIPAANVVKVDGQDFYRVKMETGDVIRGMVDNDFDLGNIIKACRRMHLAKKGMGKVGTTPEYDCKKIGYFRDEWYRNYYMEQI